MASLSLNASVRRLQLSDAIVDKLERGNVATVGAAAEHGQNDLLDLGLTSNEVDRVHSRLEQFGFRTWGAERTSLSVSHPCVY